MHQLTMKINQTANQTLWDCATRIVNYIFARHPIIRFILNFLNRFASALHRWLLSRTSPNRKILIQGFGLAKNFNGLALRDYVKI